MVYDSKAVISAFGGLTMAWAGTRLPRLPWKPRGGSETLVWRTRGAAGGGLPRAAPEASWEASGGTFFAPRRGEADNEEQKQMYMSPGGRFSSKFSKRLSRRCGGTGV